MGLVRVGHTTPTPIEIRKALAADETGPDYASVALAAICGLSNKGSFPGYWTSKKFASIANFGFDWQPM
jgi:hypothetical protein